MSTRHTYETTYEQTADDGTVTASIDVRITYDYSKEFPGYFNPIDGIGEPPHGPIIEPVKIEERGANGWEKAQPAVDAWATSLCDEDPALLIEHAIDDASEAAQ